MSTARVSNHRAVPDPNAARAASTQTDTSANNQRAPARPRQSPPSYNPQREGDDNPAGASSSTGTGSSSPTPRPAADNARTAWADKSSELQGSPAIKAVPSAATSTADGASQTGPLAAPRQATDNVPTAWANQSGKSAEAPVTKAIPSAATSTADGASSAGPLAAPRPATDNVLTAWANQSGKSAEALATETVPSAATTAANAASQAGPVAHSAHVRAARDVASAQPAPSIQDYSDPHEPTPVERARTSDLKNQERLIAGAKLANTGRPKDASENQLQLLRHSADLSLLDNEKRFAYAARADTILNLPPSQQTLEIERWQREVSADAKAVLDDPSKRTAAAFHMPTGAELFPRETAEAYGELQDAHAKYIDPSSSAQAKQEALEEAMHVKEQMQATIAQQFDALNETSARQWSESQKRVQSILDIAEHKFNADNLQIKHSDDPEWDAERAKAYAKTFPYQYVGERLLSRDGLSSQERSFPYAWRNDRHGEPRTGEQMATDLLTFQEAMNNPASDIHKRVKALEDRAFSAFSAPTNENTNQVPRPQRYSDVIAHDYQDGPDYVHDLAARYASAVDGIDHRSREMLRQTGPFQEAWHKAQYGMGMVLNSFMPPGMGMLTQGLLDATVPNQGGLSQQEQRYINLTLTGTQFIPLPGRSPGSRTGASTKVAAAPTRAPTTELGGSRPSAASGAKQQPRPGDTVSSTVDTPPVGLTALSDRPYGDNWTMRSRTSMSRSSTPTSDSEGLKVIATDDTEYFDSSGQFLEWSHASLGHTSTYRGKQADGLVLHGDIKDGVGQLIYQRGAGITHSIETQNPKKPEIRTVKPFDEESIGNAAEYLAKLYENHGIDLRSTKRGGPADPGKPIYLVACYATAGGDLSPAQQMANITGREVRAYSNYVIKSSGAAEFHYQRDAIGAQYSSDKPWYQRFYVNVRNFFRGMGIAAPDLIHKVFRPQY